MKVISKQEDSNNNILSSNNKTEVGGFIIPQENIRCISQWIMILISSGKHDEEKGKKTNRQKPKERGKVERESLKESCKKVIAIIPIAEKRFD